MTEESTKAESKARTSVSQRVYDVKQPIDGYVPLNSFSSIRMTTLTRLAYRSTENIDSNVMGLAVDYLVRFILGVKLENVLNLEYKSLYKDHNRFEIQKLINMVHGIDDDSIRTLCKILSYSCGTSEWEQPTPDALGNIRLLVQRVLDFFKLYGPIKYTGVSLLGETLNNTYISGGQIDYLTPDTVWDLKVSKDAPTKYNTLQVLIYYLIGKQAQDIRFKNICRIGIYNAKWNRAYILQIDQIPRYVLEQVSRNVIGFSSLDFLDKL